MFGVILAVIIAVWSIFISGYTMEVGFLTAAEFLWVLYWIWTIVFGILMLLFMLGFTGALTFAGAEQFRSKVGGFLGFAAGGAFSLLFMAIFAVSRGLLLGGVYLLKTAGTEQMAFAEFDMTKLIFGAILLLIGLIMSKTSASSSSSND